MRVCYLCGTPACATFDGFGKAKTAEFSRRGKLAILTSEARKIKRTCYGNLPFVKTEDCGRRNDMVNNR